MHWSISLLVRLVPPVGKWLERKLRKPDPRTVLAHRQEIMAALEKRLPKPNKYGIRGEAIIRDVTRLDEYRPHDLGPQKRSNAWFKVEVKGTYPGGLQVIYGRVRTIKFDERAERWTFVDDERASDHTHVNKAVQEDDSADVVDVVEVGELPLDRIVSVDWDGDNHYGFPHIYCEYQGKRRKPYDRTMYYVHSPHMPETYPWVQVPELEASDRRRFSRIRRLFSKRN